MSKLAIGLIATFSLMALFAISVVGWTVGFRNTCVTKEQAIKAQWDQNRNNYDNFVKSVRETAQIPEMYTDDLKKVYDSAIKSRYGQDGSKALFQFIQEHNPNVDSSVYVKVQQVIEAGRVSFAQDQKMLVDRKREYETYLQVFPESVPAALFGFPRIDLSKYDIVTSDETEKAFAAKKAEPIKLRP